MDIPKAVLWVAMLTSLATCCIVDNVEYDPEKHSILCSTNLTVAERMMKEILESNHSIDAHVYSHLVKGRLDDLMAIFRESVAEAYLKQTCQSHFCHPHVLGTVSGVVPENIPRLLDLTNIQHITSIQLQQEIIDLTSINTVYGTFITAAFVTGSEIGLFQFASDALYEMKEFNSFPGTCLATTGNVWGPPLVIVSQCSHPAVRPAPQGKPTIESYVFKPSELGLEMMQVIQSENLDISALEVYWRIGLPHILLVASPTSLHLKWKVYDFVPEDSTPLPPALDVTSFRIGEESYLVFAGREPKKGPNIFVYFSEKERPTEYRMFQRLPDCHASDVHYFSMSNLHFLLVACDQEDLSRIFWWTGTQFVLWQTIPIRRATSWTVARLPNLEVVLVAVEYPEHSPVLRFFQFESGYFWPIDQHVGLHRHRPDLKIKIVSFQHNDSTYLVVAGRPRLEGSLPFPERGSIPHVVQGIPPPPPVEGSLNPGYPMPQPAPRGPPFQQPGGGYAPIQNPNQAVPYPPRAPYRLPPPVGTGDIGYEGNYEGPDLYSQLEEFKNHGVIGDRPVNEAIAENYRVQDVYPVDVLSVFKLIARSRLTDSYAESTLDDVLKCLVDLDANIDSEHQILQQLLLPSNDTMMLGVPQIITGPKTFPNGLHATDAVVENLILGPDINVQPPNGFTCEECDKRIDHINGELNRILIETGDLVQLSQPQVITAPKKFRNVEVNGMFDVTNLTTGLVCGHDLPLMAANMLLQSGDQLITSSVDLHGNITVDTLDMPGIVNGIDLKRVATLTGSHTFTAPQTFRKVTASNVQISGTLNGINPMMAVVSDVPQELKGLKTIRGNLIVEGNINVRERINKVDLPDLVNRFVTLNTPQTIPANVTFAADLTFHQDVQVGRFRGIDLQEFSKSVVTAHEEQVLEGPVTFNSDVRVFGNVRDLGLINNINLKTDVLTTRTDQTIEHDVTILGDLFIRGNLDLETLNGLALAHEVVTTLGEQTISGRKVFRQPVTLMENLVMPPGKTVNQVDVSQVGRPIGTGQNLQVNNLNVDFINGQNVHHVLGNALRKSVKQTITGNYTFVDTTFGDLNVHGLVGGRKPERDFITTQTEQKIDRDVFFRDAVTIYGNAAVKDDKKDWKLARSDAVNWASDPSSVGSGRIGFVTQNDINGQDVSKLASVAVKIDGDQIIEGRKTFAVDITAPSVEVPPGIRINGLDLSEDLFLLNKDQEVKESFKVSEVVLNELLLEGNLNTGLLNGVNLTDFLNKVVYVDRSSVVRGRKEFLQDVKVRQQLGVNLLNGIQLNDFERKIVRLSKTQTLAGSLTFKGDVVFEGPVHVDKVNNLKLSAEAAKLVLAENGVAQHGVKFSNCFIVLQDIKNLRYLNGRDVNFANGILSKTLPQTLLLPKRFTGDITIANLHTGQLDTVVMEDVALVNQPTTILSPLVFKERLEVLSDVVIQGQLNGVFLEKLKNEAVMLRDTVIHGHKTFRNIKAGGVNLAGLLNGAKVEDLPDRIVSKNKEQVISANVVFEESISVYDLDTLAPVNGIHPTELRLQALTKGGEQKVTGEKRFTSPAGIIARKDFEVLGDVTRVDLVDGVDISQEAALAVMQGKNQTIKGEVIFHEEITFNGPLHVKGTINNLHIPKDVLLVSGDQFVAGITTFQSLTTKSIVIKDKANGVHLNHLIAKRATLHSNETIDRPMVFIEPVTVLGNLEVRAKMNNLDCRLDLVTTHIAQEIVGSKRFENVVVPNLKTDFVNKLHWLVFFNLVHSAVEKKWIHMEDIIFEEDVKLDGQWMNVEMINRQTQDLVPRIEELKKQADGENQKFHAWSQASDVCLKSLQFEIPKLVTYVDYLDIIHYLESATDLAVINFNTELHLLTVEKPKANEEAVCNNVFIHRCFQSPSQDLCSLVVWPTPLPIYNTQSILAVASPNSVVIVFRNAATALCPEQPTPSLSGTHAVILEADTVSVVQLSPVMVDAVAVLPGPQSSLIAMATNDYLDVKQVWCADVCEVLDTSINARLYDAKAVSMKWFQILNTNYLMVVSGQNVTTRTGEALSYIFRLNEEAEGTLTIIHTIHTTAATDGVAFEDRGRHFVAISSYDCTQDIASDRIDVFEVSATSVRSVQKIPLSAVALATADFLGETYLFASHALDDVLVYRLEDFFKFRLWTRIPVMAPRTIQPFVVANQLFIAVASEGTPYNHRTSPIVLAVTKGVTEVVNATLTRRHGL